MMLSCLVKQCDKGAGLAEAACFFVVKRCKGFVKGVYLPNKL